MNNSSKYNYYRTVFANERLPLAFVDLDNFDSNARAIAQRSSGKKIRIASKSIRCTFLLNRILSFSSIYSGIMCYSAEEAVFLSKNGFDDILVAYPTLQQKQIEAVCEEVKAGKQITLMADSIEHVNAASKVGKILNAVVPLCIDLDLSTRFPLLYFGVYRSPINTAEKALKLAQQITQTANVKLDGLMGYEAQIAGLGDNVPGNILQNTIIKILKNKSLEQIKERREKTVNLLKANGHNLRFVNGGGTGSIETTVSEACVTEVAAGSGFFSPNLFDNYSGFRHIPSAGFALEITRNPSPGIYTCHGGGYIASGSAGYEKLPLPWLPEGMMLTKNEGAGEVQTPVKYSGTEKINIGDPLFFRHSKAGELCERFNFLHLVSQGKITNIVPTYRGESMCFV